MLRVMKILIIEDDALTRISLSQIFSSVGEVSVCESYLEYYQKYSAESFDLLLLDLDLEAPMLGLKVLNDHINFFDYRVVLTGHEDPQVIQECYELGANDFLNKPFDMKEVILILNRFKANRIDIKRLLKEEFHYSDASNIESLENQLSQLTNSSSLLIEGETGTGKTKLAKFIHKNYFEGTFMHINCAEIPENLVESELFGHRRGAFTGANKDKTGKLRLADGGVLFLDEFTALSANLQRKLLLALEEKSFFPLGATQKEHSNFFLICASCDDIQSMRATGQLRDDFFFRIANNQIKLSPLRERPVDLKKIINHNLKIGRRVVLADEAMQLLENYSWHGNIRELKTVITRLKNQQGGFITSELVENLLVESSTCFEYIQLPLENLVMEAKKKGLSHCLKNLEKEITKIALTQNKNLVRKTIKDLKLSKSAFYRIINS
jgi:DNA-binding NtrC family response regulator